MKVMDLRASTLDDRVLKEAERLRPMFEAKCSPRGALGLPKLLDDRRVEYLIPDSVFKCQAAWERVILYPVPEFKEKLSSESSIILTDAAREAANFESPRGILISAGLQALDQLRTNGMDLGHLVKFIRMAPWRMTVDNIGGTDVWVYPLNVGDLIGSEDLREQIQRGDLRVSWERAHDGSLTNAIVASKPETSTPWAPLREQKPEPEAHSGALTRPKVAAFPGDQ